MVTVPSTLFYIFIAFMWLHIIQISGDVGIPCNFPPIPVKIGKFDNWANELVVNDLLIATPVNETDVLLLANWAFENGYRLRPSGFQHTWAPITVTKDSDRKVILVDTTKNLKNIQIDTSCPVATVTAQTGASMEQLLKSLECEGLGLYAVPALGDATIGGVLTIGGHGTGVKYVGETIPSGQALGTISNLVMSFEAVVWDEASSKFVLKTFERTDVEAKAFLVSLGRTFLTKVKLVVGPNYHLRCESSTVLTKDDLFSNVGGSNTFASLLDKTGRVETITFPFTNHPWLKVWSVTPQRPFFSRKVSTPFNYDFSDIIHEQVSTLENNITTGLPCRPPTSGKVQLAAVRDGLLATLTADIWGWSANLLLYVGPTPLRLTSNGYAVLTIRANVQKVISTFTGYVDNLVDWYQGQCLYPFNGPMEIRATTLDEPDVVAGGEVPALSAINSVCGHPEYDTAIWFDILSIPGTPNAPEAYAALESFVINEFDGTYASVRPEWSKGWAYTTDSAWSNETIISEFIPSTFPSTTATDGWNWAIQTLDKYDPDRTFSNSFINKLLP